MAFKGNFTGFRAFINKVNCTKNNGQSGVQEMWDEFKEYLSQGVLKFIPRFIKGSSMKGSERINSNILDAIKFKHGIKSIK